VPLSRNLGTLTSWNPLGHSRPVTGLLYLYIQVSRSVTVRVVCTVELHFSGLIGTASHMDRQIIQITGYFFEKRVHWWFEVWLLLFTLLTYV
jgi:hypothetical protein